MSAEQKQMYRDNIRELAEKLREGIRNCPLDEFWVDNLEDILRTELKQFLADEHEACCKDVCVECRKGDVPERSKWADQADRSRHSAWIHTMLGFDDRTEDCYASAIRERAYKSDKLRAAMEGK